MNGSVGSVSSNPNGVTHPRVNFCYIFFQSTTAIKIRDFRYNNYSLHHFPSRLSSDHTTVKVPSQLHHIWGNTITLGGFYYIYMGVLLLFCTNCSQGLMICYCYVYWKSIMLPQQTKNDFPKSSERTMWFLANQRYLLLIEKGMSDNPWYSVETKISKEALQVNALHHYWRISS